MTTDTVAARAEAPTPHVTDLRSHATKRQQADIIARMLSCAEQIRTDTPAMRPGWIALLIADANLLTRLIGNGWDRESCEALAVYVRSAAKL